MRTVRILLSNIALSAIVVAAAMAVVAADSLWRYRLPERWVLIAWPLGVVGTLLICLTVAAFAREAHATGAVGDPPQQLVTTGPLRYVRNPIYVGVASLLFAIALYRQSPSFLVTAFLFPPAIHTYVRLVEEPRLEARFGNDYLEYRRSVGRWMPHFRVSKPSP